ncbi:MAG: XcyI family restriction endonuclease [Anaerolineae bacterium]|nr:XcyI family restriction endonuclease [Anaerolineae bacterium]
MVEVTDAIEAVKGENLHWDLATLRVSQSAWNKIIHGGIKPITVFAHPEILTTVPRSVSYYRMLSMVSHKSMSQIGLASSTYENDRVLPNSTKALAISIRLNEIISSLIESDVKIDAREFIMWRGMAAGSSAQGSWQNAKGDRAEIVIKGMLKREIREKNLLLAQDTDEDEASHSQFALTDNRVVVFGAEPDIAVFEKGIISYVVEIKGGIDTAGVLERVGAAIKSLSRAKEENANAVTILIMQAVSMSQQAVNDLRTNQVAVNHWFTVEEILEDDDKRDTFFSLLNIG